MASRPAGTSGEMGRASLERYWVPNGLQRVRGLWGALATLLWSSARDIARVRHGPGDAAGLLTNRTN